MQYSQQCSMVIDAVMVTVIMQEWALSREKEGVVKCAFYGVVKGSVKVKVQSRVHSRIQPNCQVSEMDVDKCAIK
jgi:hypothetical protein